LFRVIKMKKNIYNTNDLVIARLCPVEKKNNGRTVSTLSEKCVYIIAIKNERYYLDIVSNKKYKFFQNLTFQYLEENIDEFYVDRITRLDYHIKESRKITMEEIVSLYNELNGFKNDRKKDDASNKEEITKEEKNT